MSSDDTPFLYSILAMAAVMVAMTAWVIVR